MSDSLTSPVKSQDEIPEIEHCLHETQEARRFTASNGVKHTVAQCLTCGQNLGMIGRDHPLRHQRISPPCEFDTALAGQWQQDKFDRLAIRRQGYEEERERQSAAWRLRYDTYIHSPQWRAKADQRLTHDRHECQARLDECQGRATQVHHLTYRHLENEPLFELVSVCRSCHDEVTEMDRGGNGVSS